MPFPAVLPIAALGIALALAPRPARAGSFAVCHVDSVALTLCEQCDLALSRSGFALFVNKGTAPVDGAEFFGMTFRVKSSVPDLVLEPFVDDPGIAVTPILPHEAVGSTVFPDAGLTAQLEPGETFRNISPVPLFAFRVRRVGPYEGPVTCDVSMQVGSELASFPIHFDFRRGPHAIAFRGAARASSSPGNLGRPAAQTTWGRVKVLYE